ncbi:MAG: L-threonylcarbamoyladenylate synthase, partial [Burkholderiales bacterium]|nr:L-threonylcarbamoyladenylate synthase [Burkholderiales bacterium]
AQYFEIHPTHPQPRLVRRAAAIVAQGGLIAYPTDSCYALGCHLGDTRALARLRQLRALDARHHLTLMCSDLAQVASFAMVNNVQHRMIRAAAAGSFTFILRARRQLPRRLLHPRRRTIGVRISAHPVARALVAELGEPMLSATLQLPQDAAPLSDPQEIRARLEHALDLVVDAGACGVEPTTVVDLTGDAPVVLRRGRGAPALIGLTA